MCPFHQKTRIIHIAGTSGKGSVALYLHSILSMKSKCGLVISPHIYDFNERIQVNGGAIPHEDVVQLWRGLRDQITRWEQANGQVVLFQEIILLIAFNYFRGQDVEWVIVETGLGGRFDQTRMLSPEASIITRIGLDHMHILGTTIEQIAREKAGIIHPGVPVFMGGSHNETAIEIIKRRSLELGSALHMIFPEHVHFMSFPHCNDQMDPESPRNEMAFDIGEHQYQIPQAGVHQAENASLAVAVAKEFLMLDTETIQMGLDTARLPGRIEMRKESWGRVIVDTGHNVMELECLFDTLRTMARSHSLCDTCDSSKVVVCGFAETKDHRGMLEQVMSFADIMILTKAGYRGADPGMLHELAESLETDPPVRIMVEEEPMTAFKLGRRLTEEKRDGWLVVTGSTFLVDEIFNPDEGLKEVNRG